MWFWVLSRGPQLRFSSKKSGREDRGFRNGCVATKINVGLDLNNCRNGNNMSNTGFTARWCRKMAAEI